MRLRCALTSLASATALAAALLGAAAAQAADLTVWGFQAFNPQADQYIAQLVKEFGKAKGIDAEYVLAPPTVISQRLAAALQGGGTFPDVFMQSSQRAQFYIGRNLTAPLDDVLAELRKVPGGIFENQLATGRHQGEQHALPLEVDVSPVFTRKDLLDEVGKQPPTTWDELREAAKLIQAKHPNMGALGLTVSNTSDAEGQIRNLIWSFGGKMMAEDGATVVFDSPETRAAYQFVADIFLNDRTIPRASLTWDDTGNNIAYQTGRSAFVINPPSIYYWMLENDPRLLANSLLLSIPKGPGPKGQVGNIVSSWVWLVAKQSKHPDWARDFLRYFYEPARYQAVIEKVGGRWLPIYPAMLDQSPLFAGNPHFSNFRKLAEEGFVDGYAGPPNLLAGRVWDANILTKVLHKVLIDKSPVADAVIWGQKEIEKLAKAP